MSLIPTQMTKPATEFSQLFTLIYGAPKVGKSTFCSGLEKPLFLDTENGLKNLETFRINIDGWETFRQTLVDLKADKGKSGFKTIVVDTVDNLFGFCRDYVRKKLSIQHESDAAYGKGWDAVKSEFAPAMNYLKSLDMGVIITSHAASTKIEGRTGSYDRWAPTLPKQAADVLLPSFDFILYADIVATDKGDVRLMHTKPCQYWMAGDRTGKLPSEIPLDAKEFLAAYNKVKEIA